MISKTKLNSWLIPSIILLFCLSCNPVSSVRNGPEVKIDRVTLLTNGDSVIHYLNIEHGATLRDFMEIRTINSEKFFIPCPGFNQFSHMSIEFPGQNFNELEQYLTKCDSPIQMFDQLALEYVGNLCGKSAGELNLIQPGDSVYVKVQSVFQTSLIAGFVIVQIEDKIFAFVIEE